MNLFVEALAVLAAFVFFDYMVFSYIETLENKIKYLEMRIKDLEDEKR